MVSNPSNPSIVKSVRLSLSLYRSLEEIAEYEDRTVTNVIQRFLKACVNDYYERNLNSGFGDFIAVPVKENNQQGQKYPL